MTFIASTYLLVASTIILAAILLSKIGPRVGVPTLLIFLLVGMLFGSDGLGVQFDNINHAQFIGMVALSVILFSGGMDTQIDEIRPVIKQGITLSTLGVVLTTLVTGTFIYLFTKCFQTAFVGSFALCLLLADTMSSTDSASVFSILRDQKIGLKHNAKPLLELESGSNDPMAYMLTIMLIQICKTSDFTVWGVISTFLIQFAVGSVMGILMAKGAIFLQNHINLKNVSLYTIILLCVIFMTFSLTELLHGNGYLAVYIAGIIIGNRPLVKKRECMKFMDGMTWLLQIVMFITLGLLVNPHELIEIAPLAIAISIFLIFIGRPIVVLLSLIPFKNPPTFKSRLFISWVGLRGATPIIFATYPFVAGIPGANQIFNIVFFITLISLIVQGTTIPWISKKLDMVTSLPKVGNDFGIELPEEIDSKLWDIIVDNIMLQSGNQLKDMNLPQGILVIMRQREGQYLVPNGTLELLLGDKLLVIAQADIKEEHSLQR